MWGSSKRNVNLMPLAETISHELEKRQSDERLYAENWGFTPVQFAAYLAFLKNRNFIRYDGDPIQVYITPYGADFLSYIHSRFAENFLNSKLF
jgi:hypothetical protein